MNKLPARARSVLLPFLVTMIMTAIVTAIATVRALGIHGVFYIWLSSWLFSWLVAFPTLMLVMPFVQRHLNLIIEE